MRKPFVKKTFCILGLALTAFTSSARLYAAEFFIMPELGVGDVDIIAEYTFLDDDDSSPTISASLTGGYKFDSNIVLAINTSFTTSDVFIADTVYFGSSAFDEYSYVELGMLLGYSFDVHKRFRIVPMLGASYWDLTVEEGAFLNPGPEDEKGYSGTDIYGKLNLEFPINDLIQINVSYLYGNYDFGAIEVTRVGVKFSF